MSQNDMPGCLATKSVFLPLTSIGPCTSTKPDIGRILETLILETPNSYTDSFYSSCLGRPEGKKEGSHLLGKWQRVPDLHLWRLECSKQLRIKRI